MNELITKQFEGNDLRMCKIDGDKLWFFAKDACEILGLKNVSLALKKIKNEHKGISTNNTLGGNQSVLIVSEAGLYKLIFQSRRKEADDFQDWILEDVLPSIRKTGSYSMQPAKELDELDQLRMHLTIMEKQRDEIKKLNQSLAIVAEEAKQINDTLTHDQATQLDAAMEKKYKELGVKNFKILGHMKKQVKAHFFDNPKSFTFKEIPRSGFDVALDIVKNFKIPNHLLKDDHFDS